MADKDHQPGQPGNHDAAEPGLSRRRMLGVAGAGAAGLAAGAFVAASPARAAATGPSRLDKAGARTEAPPGGGRVPPGEPVIVHVANAYSGDVNIYAGTSHTKVHDPALAAKLRRAAG